MVHVPFSDHSAELQPPELGPSRVHGVPVRLHHRHLDNIQLQQRQRTTTSQPGPGPLCQEGEGQLQVFLHSDTTCTTVVLMSMNFRICYFALVNTDFDISGNYYMSWSDFPHRFTYTLLLCKLNRQGLPKSCFFSVNFLKYF